MFHQQILLNFAERDLESFSSAWWRYKDLLIRFPFHDFSTECQLEIFLNGLCALTRCWIEREMIPTNNPSMKPTLCWKTWRSLIIGT